MLQFGLERDLRGAETSERFHNSTREDKTMDEGSAGGVLLISIIDDGQHVFNALLSSADMLLTFMLMIVQ